MIENSLTENRKNTNIKKITMPNINVVNIHLKKALKEKFNN